MATIAVIGLGNFGCRITEELIEANADLIILDKDREIIEKYKNSVLNAFITDAINEETLRKVVPPDVDAAIVDLGNLLETSILVTSHLKKIGVKQIIVKARNEDHGEILKLVGATKIVFPDLDAAVHLTPLLLHKTLFNFMQLSENFAIAEVAVLAESEGKTLAQSNLRQKYNLNVIGIRNSNLLDIQTPSPDTILTKEMILLVSGSNESINAYTEIHQELKEKSKNNNIFNRLLRRQK